MKKTEKEDALWERETKSYEQCWIIRLQGRTSIKLAYGEEKTVVADLYRKYGMVNIAIVDILNDVYLAYSTSELALEYQNGNSKVRGKDSIRYVKLGDLIPE